MAKPSTAKFVGSTPSSARLYTAGRSFRCDRSPLPPKITSVHGFGARFCATPEVSGFREEVSGIDRLSSQNDGADSTRGEAGSSAARGPLHVAAKFVAHG